MDREYLSSFLFSQHPACRCPGGAQTPLYFDLFLLAYHLQDFLSPESTEVPGVHVLISINLNTHVESQFSFIIPHGTYRLEYKPSTVTLGEFLKPEENQFVSSVKWVQSKEPTSNGC